MSDKSLLQTPTRKLLDESKWVADSDAPRCSKCGADFSVFKRRHHCRLCGNVFCDECSKYQATTPEGSTARSCKSCFEKLQESANDDWEELSEADVAQARSADSPMREVDTLVPKTPREITSPVPVTTGAATASAVPPAALLATPVVPAATQIIPPRLVRLVVQFVHQYWDFLQACWHWENCVPMGFVCVLWVCVCFHSWVLPFFLHVFAIAAIALGFAHKLMAAQSLTGVTPSAPVVEHEHGPVAGVVSRAREAMAVVSETVHVVEAVEAHRQEIKTVFEVISDLLDTWHFICAWEHREASTFVSFALMLSCGMHFLVPIETLCFAALLMYMCYSLNGVGFIRSQVERYFSQHFLHPVSVTSSSSS